MISPVAEVNGSMKLKAELERSAYKVYVISIYKRSKGHGTSHGVFCQLVHICLVQNNPGFRLLLLLLLLLLPMSSNPD